MDCKSIFFHIIKNEKVIQIILAIVISFLFQQNLNAQKVETTKESVNYTIENFVNEFDLSKAKKQIQAINIGLLTKNSRRINKLKMRIVEPGKSTHAPHRHPEEEFFYILEGKAAFYLNGKTVEVGPNSSLYCPPNSEHGISNAGDKDLK